MSRNEKQTCKELIEPALQEVGWSWDEQVTIGHGRVNLSGDAMYDPTQRLIADYVLRLNGMPLAVLEVKREDAPAADGIQQSERYAKRLQLQFSIVSNGHEYILIDNDTGEYETYHAPPSPGDLLHLMGRNVAWESWKPVFEAPWHVDQVTRKPIRPYQEMAIFETLYRFSQEEKRVLLLMATGTGKTFTVFQLIWKLINGGILENNHVLFLTDRNSLKDQAYRSFSGFTADERVVIDKDTVQQDKHRIGKVFFANYQNLDETLNGRKLYAHYEPDFFDLVIVDECHRSGFGDWFGVLEHFSSAFQLGLTATPRELEPIKRPFSDEESRRDTYEYFGDPVYTYSLKDAIDDGYLVPYLMEERITNVDEEGFIGPDGKAYHTQHFERDIRLPDRTKLIAEDLWACLGRYGLRDSKTIIFCVDDTHAAFMAQELRRLSGNNDYAARITRSERHSHALERKFQEVSSTSYPRVAVTVDLLSTGYDAPDVKNIVFARPIKSSILYKQMKGRGTRLCEDINKRYFTIFDYAGATAREDAEFDGHPANLQKSRMPTKSKPSAGPAAEKPIMEGVSVYISSTEQFVSFADGHKIPFDEYCLQTREAVRHIAPVDLQDLLNLWIDKQTRHDLRETLIDQNIHITALQHYFGLDGTDEVDILAKVGFDLPRVPMRRDRVARFWMQDEDWLMQRIDETNMDEETRRKTHFWATCMDHYALFGVDDLEQGKTYSAPQFTAQFGSFSAWMQSYGGAQALKDDLEAVKQHLYVPMAS